MSRSNRSEDREPNPASLFLEWSPKHGVLQYYDKESKQNIAVKLPFTFIVLDEVSTVGGGTKRNGKFEGFWSNAVKNLDHQPFTVRSKNGVEATGLWSELKDRKALSFVKGLYVAYKPSKNEPLAIAYLKFQKSSLGAWFDYTKVYKDIYNGAIVIKGPSEVIHGEMGDYYLPILEPKPEIPAELEQEATALDANVLRPFLTRYFAKSAAPESNGNAGEHHVERGDYDQTRPDVSEPVHVEEEEDDGWGGGGQAEPAAFAPPAQAQRPAPAGLPTHTGPPQAARPLPPAAAQPASVEQGRFITQTQLRAIRNLIQPMGYPEPDVALEYTAQRTSKLEELSQAEAAQAIKNLQG